MWIYKPKLCLVINLKHLCTALVLCNVYSSFQIALKNVEFNELGYKRFTVFKNLSYTILNVFRIFFTARAWFWMMQWLLVALWCNGFNTLKTTNFSTVNHAHTVQTSTNCFDNFFLVVCKMIILKTAPLLIWAGKGLQITVLSFTLIVIYVSNNCLQIRKANNVCGLINFHSKSPTPF